MFVRRIVRLALLCATPLALAGCAPSSPQAAIVGTWQSGVGNNKLKVTYWENGVWQFDNGHGKTTGRYKFLSDDTVEMRVDPPPGAEPLVYSRHVSFSNRDTMNTTEDKSIRRTTWKRVE